MNIGDIADRCGLPTKTIRYYEDIGLVKPSRDANGYRRFGETDLHKLTFLARSRSLGFSIEDCRLLLSLYEDRSRASADVRAVAETNLHRIEAKIEELNALKRTLTTLINKCHGDDRPDCPILDDLSARGS